MIYRITTTQTITRVYTVTADTEGEAVDTYHATLNTTDAEQDYHDDELIQDIETEGERDDSTHD